jgi:hypothetical protein
VVARTGGQGGRPRVRGAEPHRRGGLGGDSGVDPRPGRAADSEVVGESGDDDVVRWPLAWAIESWSGVELGRSSWQQQPVWRVAGDGRHRC